MYHVIFYLKFAETQPRHLCPTEVYCAILASLYFCRPSGQSVKTATLRCKRCAFLRNWCYLKATAGLSTSETSSHIWCILLNYQSSESHLPVVSDRCRVYSDGLGWGLMLWGNNGPGNSEKTLQKALLIALMTWILGRYTGLKREKNQSSFRHRA